MDGQLDTHRASGTESGGGAGGGVGSRGADCAIAALAERQHGVVGRRQLVAAGIGVSAIDNRIARGRLHRVHRGVYAVGHPVLSGDGRLSAAVLAAGAAAVLSHASAAHALGVRRSAAALVDVTTPRSAKHRRGIRVHRSASLTDDEVTLVRGIPCTTVARTLIDLGDLGRPRVVEQALDGAEVLRVFDLGQVQAALDRHRRRPGAAVLRAVLERHAAGSTVTRSELEERFLSLCGEAGLPRPELNVPLPLEDGAVATVDALWRTQRVVVETDGRAAHATRHAFEADRWRDAQLQRAGYAVVRLTWRRIADDGPAVARTLRELLALPAGGPRGAG